MNTILDKGLWKIGFYGPIPISPLRPFVDGPSFYMMHKEIYRDKAYLFRRQRDTPLIIDCGSNYGVSILWFKKIIPTLGS